jgi:hypothetical protein
MKKILTLLCITVLLTTLTSCKTNMRRDAKLLAHKTEQCFSLIDTTEEAPSDESKAKFSECYNEMEQMMDKYDNKYKNDKSSRKFSEMYLEEIRKTDLNEDIKNTFEDIYSMANEMSENNK